MVASAAIIDFHGCAGGFDGFGGAPRMSKCMSWEKCSRHHSGRSHDEFLHCILDNGIKAGSTSAAKPE